MFRQSMLVLALFGAIGVLGNPADAGRGGRGGGGQTAQPLSVVEQADLIFMRQEEKLARDVYLQNGETYGIATFDNIATSEQRHMDAILQLLQRYRLTDPVVGLPISEFVDPELQALHDNLMGLGAADALSALKVGGLIEEVDMRDIVAAIERSQHADIDSVYANLLCGSRNHLRAFAGQIELTTGLPYAAQVLPQVEVDAILATGQERCGN
ncbi:MAG: DUF2202 domain-containing protein [Rhodanobacteraceae bacterium]|nr:DUF2202 domain-containing protein [Rhodanobacteraceae bacterium]